MSQATGKKGRALITGASGGIGLEFARKFASEGYDLVLVARSEGKLNELANELKGQHGTQVKVLAKDLNSPGAPQEIFDTLKGEGVQVEVLVNNAGFAAYGHFATEIDANVELQMMQLNVVTLTHMTKLFIKPMVERRSGKILNVASTAAFAPGPLMAVYYASKAYVLSFSEAIACELQGSGVTVTALCPGPTRTGFQERATMQESKLVQSGLMSVTDVVNEGYRAMMNGKAVSIPGLYNKISSLLPRFIPRGMAARIVMQMQQRVGH
jgi:uncharacterized protein